MVLHQSGFEVLSLFSPLIQSHQLLLLFVDVVLLHFHRFISLRASNCILISLICHVICLISLLHGSQLFLITITYWANSSCCLLCSVCFFVCFLLSFDSHLLSIGIIEHLLLRSLYHSFLVSHGSCLQIITLDEVLIHHRLIVFHVISLLFPHG